MDRQYDIEVLRSLTSHIGWKEYQKILSDRFTVEYAKYRKVKSRSDITFGHIGGFLDGIEYAQRCANSIIAEADNAPESTGVPAQGE